MILGSVVMETPAGQLRGLLFVLKHGELNMKEKNGNGEVWTRRRVSARVLAVLWSFAPSMAIARLATISQVHSAAPYVRVGFVTWRAAGSSTEVGCHVARVVWSVAWLRHS